MPFCRQCGKEIQADALFCPECGAAQATGTAGTTGFSGWAKNVTDTTDTTAEFDPTDIAQNKGMAILAYFGILVLFPILGAKHSRFAQYHANQGLILLIVSLAYGVADAILEAVLGWVPVLGALASLVLLVGDLLILAMAILGIVNAAKGVAKEVPLVGKYRLLNY